MPGSGLTRRRFLVNASLAAGALYARPLRALETSTPARVQTPGGLLRGEFTDLD